MTKKIAAIIPARMGSFRFPGKPLATILGLPMIEHVRRRVTNMALFSGGVYVATCDEEIKKVVEEASGKVIITSDTHDRAADRVEEAAHKLDCDVVVMVQGDEPMVVEEPLRALIEPFFKDETVGCACLVYPIKDPKDLPSPNIVKTVQSQSGNLIYFSRSIIPGNEVHASFPYLKQSGIMAFTKARLHEFAELESTPLERKESCDMLRYIEHDLPILGVYSTAETKGVDLPEQVRELEEAIQSDPEQFKLFESIQ